MIIPATVADAEDLNRLVNLAYRGDTSKAGWASEADLFDGSRVDLQGLIKILSTPGILILKYIEDEQLKGCVELHREGNSLYLGMLSVLPHLQNSGIGKKLLKASEEEAKRQNCVSVIMTVITQRHALMQWYNRHGYLNTGVRKPFDTSDPRHGVPKMEIELATLEKKL